MESQQFDSYRDLINLEEVIRDRSLAFGCPSQHLADLNHSQLKGYHEVYSGEYFIKYIDHFLCFDEIRTDRWGVIETY